MILEVADIRIHPGQQADFEKAVRRGVDSAISKAKGFLGYTIHTGIENPERYLLQIRWATLEDHTIAFRGSAAFTEWRALVGPFFASPPVVEHFNLMTST